MTFAFQQGVIAEDLAANVKHLFAKRGVVTIDEYVDGDADPTKWNILEPDEWYAFYAAMDPYYQPLIKFLVRSGCRWAEATALRPDDIDRKNNTVNVRRAWLDANSADAVLGPPKFGSYRVIGVPADVLADLDYSNPLLFTKKPTRRHQKPRPDGKPRPDALAVKAYTLSTAWAKALKAAGIDKPLRVHDLRHTACSWAVNDGLTPRIQIMEHMGHKSLSTTDLYSHAVPGVSDLASNVDAFLAANRSATVLPFPARAASAG